ncbi:hypothetical protein IQ235_05955 [Oscillatoriales cyanobacterium LEGE 11467]|uniref:Uncharacterized protein n=1 Tax=Zarconia navalis LEGE 11467 TaxID=1828826 RepID=A0A928VZ46_9CYAN|nr:hypothetical protein [Zarconia navalis]MBE9040335.1 hypothetical protein [Zarconia navalis LEGE 11467]
MADSFYLEPDDSKSLGDMDYMRTVKRVRRTYAKYKNGQQGGMKTTKSVSATDNAWSDDNGFNNSSSFSSSSESSTTSSNGSSTSSWNSSSSSTSSWNSSSSSSSSSSSTSRRSPDTGMDMFRKMAKDMKR